MERRLCSGGLDKGPGQWAQEMGQSATGMAAIASHSCPAAAQLSNKAAPGPQAQRCARTTHLLRTRHDTKQSITERPSNIKGKATPIIPIPGGRTARGGKAKKLFFPKNSFMYLRSELHSPPEVNPPFNNT